MTPFPICMPTAYAMGAVIAFRLWTRHASDRQRHTPDLKLVGWSIALIWPVPLLLLVLEGVQERAGIGRIPGLSFLSCSIGFGLIYLAAIKPAIDVLR